MDLLVRNFIFNWRAEGKKSVLSKFGLEKQIIEMTEDSSNIARHFPFVRSLHEGISVSGQFSISNLLEMLDLCNYHNGY